MVGRMALGASGANHLSPRQFQNCSRVHLLKIPVCFGNFTQFEKKCEIWKGENTRREGENTRREGENQTKHFFHDNLVRFECLWQQFVALGNGRWAFVAVHLLFRKCGKCVSREYYCSCSFSSSWSWGRHVGYLAHVPLNFQGHLPCALHRQVWFKQPGAGSFSLGGLRWREWKAMLGQQRPWCGVPAR